MESGADGASERDEQPEDEREPSTGQSTATASSLGSVGVRLAFITCVAPAAKAYAQGRARERQQQTFDEQSGENPAPARPQRQPRSDLTLARRRASEQQGRDVRGGDDEYEARAREEGREQRTHAAVLRAPGWFRLGPTLLVPIGRRRQLPARAGHLR
mgnify:CR=1 FL=1